MGSKVFRLEKVDALRTEDTSVWRDGFSCDIEVCLIVEGMLAGLTVDMTEVFEAILLRDVDG